MRICQRCVNPDTRPNIEFDDEGICPVCRFAEANASGQVDWDARDRELADIVTWGRDHTKNSYDCIVTVSGGKDSMRQAFYARDHLGTKPLLVSCVYPPEQLNDRGADNLSNLVEQGFDCISVSLNPQLWKDLMRQGFLLYGNWCKSTEMALYAIPIHVAIAYKIPLIFLGENPAWTIGEKHGRLDGDASRMKYCNTLQGGDPSPLMSDTITSQDVYFYKYPDDDEIDYAALRIVYLGYYIREWSGWSNAEFAIERGLRVRDEGPEDTGDIWGVSSVDEDFRLVNQMIKHIKFGFGFVTDQVCEQITQGRMTREEGLALVRQYDGRCAPKYIDQFCSYLGITLQRFWEVVERFRGAGMWKKGPDGEWVLDYPHP